MSSVDSEPGGDYASSGHDLRLEDGTRGRCVCARGEDVGRQLKIPVYLLSRPLSVILIRLLIILSHPEIPFASANARNEAQCLISMFILGAPLLLRLALSTIKAAVPRCWGRSGGR